MSKILFIVYILILMMLSACRENIVLSTNEYGTTAKNILAKVEMLDVTHWDVDIPTKKEVAVGIIIKIALPTFRPEDIEFLSTKYKIDSWLIRLYRESNYSRRSLADISIRLDQSWSGSTEFASLRVFYNAAIMSQYQKRFNCPVKGHNKKIENFEVSSTDVKKKDMFIMPGEVLFLAEEQSVNPLSINGGDSLLGTYTVEYALFSRTEKKLYSDFFSAEGKAVIDKEGSITFETCRKED